MGLSLPAYGQWVPSVAKPCPLGIAVEGREMRESAPAKPPVRKQSLCLMCKQGAGTPLTYMCADRLSDLKYALQIPLSLRKVAGSEQPWGSKWFLINQPPRFPTPANSSWWSVFSGCQLPIHLAGTFKPAKMRINKRAFREKMADLSCRPFMCWVMRGTGGSSFKAVLCQGYFSNGTDNKVFFF